MPTSPPCHAAWGLPQAGGERGGIRLTDGHPAARAAVGPGEAPGEHGGMVRSGGREIIPKSHPAPPAAAHPGFAPGTKEHPRRRGVRRNRVCRLGIETAPQAWHRAGGPRDHPPSPASTSLCSGVLPGPHSHACTLERGWSRSRQLCRGMLVPARSRHNDAPLALVKPWARTQQKAGAEFCWHPRMGRKDLDLGRPGWLLSAALCGLPLPPSPEVSLLGLIFIAGCTGPPPPRRCDGHGRLLHPAPALAGRELCPDARLPSSSPAQVPASAFWAFKTPLLRGSHCPGHCQGKTHPQLPPACGAEPRLTVKGGAEFARSLLKP